jgi:hypothetical protein
VGTLGGKPGKEGSGRLLASQAEALDQALVACRVFSVEVVQQAPALTDHSEQSAAGVVVLLVDLEVLGEFVDTRSEKRHLDLGRSCVLLVLSMGLNDL